MPWHPGAGAGCSEQRPGGTVALGYIHTYILGGRYRDAVRCWVGQGERLSEDVHREVLAFREVGDQADKLGRRVLEHGRTRYWSGRDRAGRGG